MNKCLRDGTNPLSRDAKSPYLLQLSVRGLTSVLGSYTSGLTKTDAIAKFI